MRALSTFSGIGGMDLGLERAGHTIVAQCEANPWRRAILAQHWSDVPCFDDVRTLRAEHLNGPIDLLVGGFPCQDVSVAGNRAGLAGARSGLFFEFARLADELIQPGGWLLIENVPGLLSSHKGRDFAIVLATLAELGFHDLAYRVLDSRYFGVPQRRRRVFIVARRAAGRRACEVLLEPESGGGDFATCREARADAAAAFGQRPPRAGRTIAVSALDRARGGADDNDAQANRLVAPAVVRRYAKGTDSDASDTLILGPQIDSNGVRALAGLPGRLDDPKPDGPRYEACGDAVTVPVAEWIGSRLMTYEKGMA